MQFKKRTRDCTDSGPGPTIGYANVACGRTQGRKEWSRPPTDIFKGSLQKRIFGKVARCAPKWRNRPNDVDCCGIDGIMQCIGPPTQTLRYGTEIGEIEVAYDQTTQIAREDAALQRGEIIGLEERSGHAISQKGYMPPHLV